MEDMHVNTNQSATPTAAGPDPQSAPPKHQSPIDQTKDAAKKVLAMITGRPKS
ncbi:MAG TPA: hypothetical protein VID68_00970 [Solirubrobacteraceae bacterium]|jgi:hypothetical protein